MTNPLSPNHNNDSLLQQHKERLHKAGLTALFEQDPQRFTTFSAQSEDLLLDFSKNHIDQECFRSLIKLAEDADLLQHIDAMFSGKPINNTENRPVLHTALRAKQENMPSAVAEDILTTKQRMYVLADRLENKEMLGCTGKPINTIVNIGVGGSDLGPDMAINALLAYHNNECRYLFASNIDPVSIHRILATCNPETTLFIICSKTFTTLETLANATTARNWFLQAMPDETAIQHHFLAVSTNLKAAADFGIPDTHIFPMWDWVGGRYSIWSAIGLSLALAIGRKGFEAFLNGGNAMDTHFQNAPLERNLPVIMAVLGVWYSNYFHTQSQAVICYEENLTQFPAYLQQLDMESNGKTVTKVGTPVTQPTGSILWGGVGTNTQHSFHQLIHQGAHLIPVDFLVGIQSTYAFTNQNQQAVTNQQSGLFSNCLAQSQAMMKGRSKQALLEEMKASGIADKEAEFLSKHRYIEGNKPSNTLVYTKLTPFVLGQLIALYEHKVFTQSVIWGINAFDQWGVELGKQLSKTISQVMKNPELAARQDSSTQGLIQYYSDNI